MAVLTVLKSTMAGQDVTNGWTAADAGGDQFANNGDTILVCQSTGGTPSTLTFATPGKVDGLEVASVTYAISNSAIHLIGPFPAHLFNDGSGILSVAYSSVSGLYVRPVELV